MSAINMLILLLILAITSVIANVWDYTVFSSEGEEIPMTKYNSAKVLIIVNVASNCGYTYSNYRELVDIYDKYHGRGLEILAFPSNQFGEQEPGTDSEIQSFCNNFGITSPF